MMLKEQCLCAEYWPGQGHPEDCPVRQEVERLSSQVAALEQEAEGLRYTSDKQTVAWKERALRAEEREELLHRDCAALTEERDALAADASGWRFVPDEHGGHMLSVRANQKWYPESHLTAQAERLREALLSLRNEAHGMVSAFRPELVEAVSLTNVACLEARIKQADAALAEAPPPLWGFCTECNSEHCSCGSAQVAPEPEAPVQEIRGGGIPLCEGFKAWKQKAIAQIRQSERLTGDDMKQRIGGASPSSPEPEKGGSVSTEPRRLICHYECRCGGMGVFVNSCSNYLGHDGPHNHGPRVDCPWTGIPKPQPQHRLAVLD